MTEERRTQGDRRAPTTVSVRRLEGKVDQVIKRQNQMYLNGDAAALRDLARFWRESGAQLQKLVEVAPTIIAAVEHDADMAAFWRVTKRALNPLKPLGALIWALVVSAATAIVWNLLTTNHAFLHH